MLNPQVEAFGRFLAQVLRDAPLPQGSEVNAKDGSWPARALLPAAR